MLQCLVILVNGHVRLGQLGVGLHLLRLGFGVLLVAAYIEVIFLVLNTIQKFILFKVEKSHFVTNAALGLSVADFLRHLEAFIVIFDGEGNVMILLVFVGGRNFMVNFN